MKITDVPFSSFTLKVKFTKDMEDYLLELFTDFLQAQRLISKSAKNKTLKVWVHSVTYKDFSELYDTFWNQLLGEIPGGKVIEILGGIGVQISSIFSLMKPPKRSIIRETGKSKIALKLLDLVG